MGTGRLPTIRLRRLAGELTRLRTESGYSREEVASHLGVAFSTVYRIETGLTRPRARTLRDLLDLYDADPAHRAALTDLARDAGDRGWWHDYGDVLPGPYVGLEWEAVSVRNYESVVIPGLLQTADYARAVISAALEETPKATGRRVALRLQRQRKLDQRDFAMWVVLDEGVVWRRVGGPRVMAQQLRHLHELANRPNITIQVLSLRGGAYLGMGSPFSILSFAGPADGEVVLLENPGGELYLEAPDQLRRCAHIFDHLRAAALSPERSLETLESAEKEMTS
ncbi:helix-turn-helix domain-containing protein [Herbidospora cretacea]|uniref:helix-turn-helix domain-containing protein n=1 Tax=Herbidospora cretacea TaxID=28444 RepID=UPI0004C3958F|nr:helix-turn-helix transcriptional regulator [Herbidospora cretacea]